MQWNCKYVPILKTSDAELRALRELSDEQKSKFIPVFELTKSRRTQKDRIGKISKRLESIREIMDDKPFILDLMTAHESMMNTEIENLLDEYDGFEAWFNFVVEQKRVFTNLIPMIHIVPDELQEVTKLTEKLASEFECLAVRVESLDEGLGSYLEAINEGIEGKAVSLVVIVDSGYFDKNTEEFIRENIKDRLSELANFEGTLSAVVVSSSSFPSSVTDVAGDTYGKMPQLEKNLFASVDAENFIYNLVYGDYASVHPIRYDVGGYGWVPRVDISTTENYIYYRYRRESGGYISAAEKMVKDTEYEKLGVWGNKQIDEAADGSPNGLSPSFWISVRINIHISRVLIDIYP